MSRQTRFVIAGTQRTGTTLIRTTLGSHSEIRCLGEVFKLGKKPYREDGGYWQYCRSNTRTRVASIVTPDRSIRNYLKDFYDGPPSSAAGFKLMLSHCLARPCIWPMLRDLGVRAIWVRRRNVLKTLVSRKMAAASGIYHVARSRSDLPTGTGWEKPETKGRRMIAIDVSRLIEDLEAIRRDDQTWQDMLRGTQYIEVVYENYAEDKNSGNDLLLDFLEVPRQRVQSGLHKVNADTLAELISNYDDVESTLKGTRYEVHLDNHQD